MTNQNTHNESEFEHEKSVKKTKIKSATPALDKFATNLIALAEAGKIDPVYHRDIEIKKIIEVLNKRKKNNPILIGEAGVGKTAIVEGLAISIANGEAGEWLMNKKIYDLNMTSMVSGTKFRGQFEERMEAVIKEIEENDDVIVFFDEIHNVIGAGAAAGSLDAANIIKPALSRGTLKCIGATTSEEFKKIIENDSAFERRFQKIYISIPNKKETFTILEGIKNKYEDYHNVSFSSDVIKDCINLTDRYINYRHFPDKAIDAIDETGARIKMESQMPTDLRDLMIELKEVGQKKRAASSIQEFEEAAKHKDVEMKLEKQVEAFAKEWTEQQKENKITVSSEDIAKTIAFHTGIPLEKISGSEMERLGEMEEHLKKMIIGQDLAVKKVTEAIQRSKVGIQDPNKPIASFLFLGSTGVGKTELAKKLAEYLFSSKESFIRIDMSEYMEKHSVAKMIGSPPGYIGHDDKGQLTEMIKKKPYSVLLFDEIEKAHPDVYNILLQMLDEGKLTDSTGFEVNFKNIIVIMTSNIGTRNIVDHKQSVGFSFKSEEKAIDVEKTVFKELEKRFRPELLNRIDEKLVFKLLGKDEILKIVGIELKYVTDRIIESGYKIKITDSVVKFIADVGFSTKYGARPVKRAITNHVETLVSKAIISGEIEEGKAFSLVYDKKAEKIKINKRK